MRIPIGCTFDRATGERKDLYRECTPEEAEAFASAILRAAAEMRKSAAQQEHIEKAREYSA